MAEVFIGEYVEPLELDTLCLEHLHHRVAEPAHWRVGHALHEDDHLVLLNVLADLLLDAVGAGGVGLALRLEVIVHARAQ